jgi:hypothetical protein
MSRVTREELEQTVPWKPVLELNEAAVYLGTTPDFLLALVAAYSARRHGVPALLDRQTSKLYFRATDLDTYRFESKHR